MTSAAESTTERELYALLHISPHASDEEIRKAFRQWAQVYHPDKYQARQMKDIATENFQRIRDAYEILADETKRQIYDIYGMEGLTSGFELGPKLNRPEEIREELEKLRRQKEEQKFAAHVPPSGSLLANFSLPQYLQGGGIMRGMAMGSEVQSQVSKRNTVSVGGNLVVTGDSGTGTASMSLQHRPSSVSTIEFMATAGLRSIIGMQTSRHLSIHSTGTSGIMINLKDGSVNLSNTWTRQLSDTAAGNNCKGMPELVPGISLANGQEELLNLDNELVLLVHSIFGAFCLYDGQESGYIMIQLVLGAESAITVGWQKKDEKNSASGELKFGTRAFGASAHYVHRFSSKSHGRVAGRIGSTDLEFEVGGGRRISEFSSVRMLYTLGIQGIFWRFELHRGGQKLIIPILLATGFDSLFAAGALMIPSSLYLLLKKFVFKPYYLRREREKALEEMEKSSAQIQEARIDAEKAQQLLQNVSNRKRNKQMELNGLVITKAVYGNSKALKRRLGHREADDEVASQVTDVTIPLNFLVDDFGKLKLHEGIKKSGIMGFYDPCPGEPKQLLVDYTYSGLSYQVAVDDYEQLIIPHDTH